MKEVNISEIFLSFQGEGPFIGSRQLFVRFFGCNLNCLYCDTLLSNYKKYTIDTLLNKLLEFNNLYNELTLTGGEPLLWNKFLKHFLPIFKKHVNVPIYLETNGTLDMELKDILDWVDIISMDFKFPSSSNESYDFWDAHKRFIDFSKTKDLIVKVVITDATKIDDIKKMGQIFLETKVNVPIILQPVTVTGASVNVPDDEMLLYFKEYIKKEITQDVNIIGQIHKIMGVR